MRHCEMCGQPVINNNSSQYCRGHSELATLAQEIRHEAGKAIARDGRMDERQRRLLDLWQSLSDEARFTLSVYAAQVWRNIRRRALGDRGFGALSALELTVCILQELEAAK